MSQPNNPDQEPFRPASYDLTSSFDQGEGQGQGQPGQHPPVPGYPPGYQGYPGYPDPPPSGPPSPPMGPPPMAPPPGPAGRPSGFQASGPLGPPAGGYSGVYHGSAPGSVQPAPPRRSRSGLWITLGIVGVVLVAVCCGGGLWARPFLDAMVHPARVSAPERVAGMDSVSNPDLKATADKIAADLKSQTSATNAVAGYWAPPGDQQHLTFAIAVAALILQPGDEAKRSFDSMKTSGLTVNDIHDYDAGDQGGTVQCGTAKVENVPVSLCVWADNASAGIGGFFNRDVGDAAKLFLSVRNDMVTRS